MEFEDFMEKAKDVKIDVNAIKEIRRIEELYNNKGRERIKKLVELTKGAAAGTIDFEHFIFGYSECGQDMHKEMEELRVKAAKWDALMNCERIRILGSAGLGTDRQHFGMEIWSKYQVQECHGEDAQERLDKSNITGQEVLNKFTDTIVGRTDGK